MAYRPHILVQWGGALGTNSGEIWTNTMRFVTDGTDVNDLQGLAEAWDTELTNALTTLVAANSGYASHAHLDWVKANAVDATGHQLAGNTNAYYAPTDFVSAKGIAPSGAYQLALVVSFTTDVSRGWANSGRVYVPSGAQVGTNIDSPTGLLTDAYVASVAAAWQTFLNDLNDNPGPDFADLRAAVVSPRAGDGSAFHNITGVRVGKVMDTQRRRRNRLVENYTDPLPIV